MAPEFSKSMIETLVKETVAKFTTRSGSKAGDNVAGDIYAVQVETISGRTFDLVIKTPPENNAQLREWVLGAQLFALEHSMYTSFKDSLVNLVKTSGVPDDAFDIPLPVCFGGKCVGADSWLCLEDIRPQGFKMPDKFAGLNFDEVGLVLQELAKFHALTYSLIKYEGEAFFENVAGMTQVQHNFFTEDSPMLDGATLYMFGNGLQVIKDCLAKRAPNLAERLDKGMPSSDVLRLMGHTRKLTDLKTFPVIVHGDFWVNNILLKYDEKSGTPTAVKFVDFQQTHRGNIYEDLIYFMFCSTTPEFRRRHLHQMLNVYYKAFQDALKLLKAPEPQNFTLGGFVDTYFGCYLSGLLYMTYAVPMQLGVDQNDVAGQESDDRNAVMVAKLTRMMQGSPRALVRMEAIVQEFVDLGLL